MQIHLKCTLKINFNNNTGYLFFERKTKIMLLTSTHSEIRFKNAEQFLGCKEERYFASGYKKITCELFDYDFSDDKLTASLNLNCGKSWSIKNGEIIDQHLGSIESSLIAIRSLELFLSVKYNLTDDEISTSYIKRIEFKTKPCNTSLNQQNDIEVTPIHLFRKSTDSFTGNFEILVKNFQFLIELDMSQQFNPAKQCGERFTENINSPAHYYHQGYRLTSIDIENLLLNVENRSVIAESKITNPLEVFEAGLGTKNLRGLSFVEFLSIAGQLTQVLLYKLENISREESNNMWVRSLSADFLPKKTNQQIGFTSKAYFTEFNLVKIKGEVWRTVSAKFEIGNIQGSAKVCHII